jgi:NADH-quinone oxidoreductase subunit J
LIITVVTLKADPMDSLDSLALEVGRTLPPEAIMFWILAPIAVAAALGMLFAKKAVHSALLLAWVMITLAIFYIAQDALFLGIVQIIVYTGAVMMLFLFILMLVGVDSSDSLVENIRGQRPASITAAIGLGGLLVSLIARANIGVETIGLQDANSKGNVQGIANELFKKYVWAFEVVSALLITAALGAMVLAHSTSTKSRTAQRDLSIARFRGASLATAAGLPSSGVYALHNAVDVPALLPDGTPAPSSVSATLDARGDMLSSKPFELEVKEVEED